MKLNEEQKQQILDSLKADYIVFSHVFHEICADAFAHIIMTNSLNTLEGRADRLELREVERNYFRAVPENYMEVIPYVETALRIKCKYSKLRYSNQHNL